MLIPVVALLRQTTVSAEAGAADRIGPPAAVEGQIDQLTVRVSSPKGVLWQGVLRVANNQGASAIPKTCRRLRPMHARRTRRMTDPSGAR